VPELWSNFGIFERTRLKDETVYSDFCMVTRTFFNEDSFELIVRPKKQQILVVPIGYHLNFRHTVAGESDVDWRLMAITEFIAFTLEPNTN